MTGRAKGGAPDWAASVRLRVPHLLGTAALEPRGMAPSATLIVRRLSDPLPKGLMTDAEALSATRAWDNAAQSRLTDIFRNAARPASGAVAGDAPAVLFADQAELLACLARDLIRGVASSLWWWRAILRGLPAGAFEALFEAWRRDCVYIPGALARLASDNLAAPVLLALTSSQAWYLLDQVTGVFDLHALRQVLNTPVLRVDGGLSGGPHVSVRAALTADPLAVSPFAADSVPAADVSFATVLSPPWNGFIAASNFPANFGIERSALLGIGLALHRVPSFARSRRFADEFSLWRRGSLLHLRQLAADVDARPFDGSGVRQPPRAVTGADGIAVSPDEGRIDEPRKATGPDAALPEQLPGASLTVRDEEAGVQPVASSVAPRAAGVAPEFDAFAHEAASAALSSLPSDSAAPPVLLSTIEGTAPAASLAVTQPEHPVLSPPGDAWFGEAMQTELGGVLFLVTLLKSLRLPASLEEECSQELGIGTWEVLELCARCLLGPGATHLIHDPVWRALARLDGRAAEVPAGSGFIGRPCYRLPESWLAALPPMGRPAIRCRDTRVEMWHPAGIVISDCEVAGAAEVRAMAGSGSRYGARGEWAGAAPLGVAPGRPLRRFLSFLMPYLRWRLAASLGLRHTSRHRLATILQRPATVWLTSTHVDVVMDLNQASGPIRLSGLDADPGWLPDFGHVIQFHYRASNAL